MSGDDANLPQCRQVCPHSHLVLFCMHPGVQFGAGHRCFVRLCPKWDCLLLCEVLEGTASCLGSQGTAFTAFSISLEVQISNQPTPKQCCSLSESITCCWSTDMLCFHHHPDAYSTGMQSKGWFSRNHLPACMVGYKIRASTFSISE